MSEIKPVDLSPKGIAECGKLMRLVFANTPHLTDSFFDWQYNKNPLGPAIGFNAYDNGELISHCVVLPTKVKLFGKVTNGVHSVNGVSHPRFQGTGLYFRLAKRTYQLAKDKGYEFGFSISNDLATPGWTRLIGFQYVSPLLVKVGAGTFAHKKDEPQVDFERVWDKEMLEWRCSCPSIDYRLEKNGTNFSIFGPTNKFGIQVVMRQLPKSLLPEKVESHQLGMNPVRVWTGFDPALNWKRAAYVTLPEKLKPSPLNFLFKDMTGENRVLKRDRIRCWPLDFDDF